MISNRLLGMGIPPMPSGTFGFQMPGGLPGAGGAGQAFGAGMTQQPWMNWAQNMRSQFGTMPQFQPPSSGQFAQWGQNLRDRFQGAYGGPGSATNSAYPGY